MRGRSLSLEPDQERQRPQTKAQTTSVRTVRTIPTEVPYLLLRKLAVTLPYVGALSLGVLGHAEIERSRCPIRDKRYIN